MQNTPGMGRGMTVDFSEDIPIPSAHHASSQSVVAPSKQKHRPSSASSADKSHMKLAANFGLNSTFPEHHLLRPDAGESQGSFQQEQQLQQMLQLFQRQLQPSEWAVQPSPYQFDPTSNQGQILMQSAGSNSEQQQFVSHDQQQQQQQQQQQHNHVHQHYRHHHHEQQQQQQQPVQILKRPSQPKQQAQPQYQHQQQPQESPLHQLKQQQHQLSPPPTQQQWQQKQQQQQQQQQQVQQPAFPGKFVPPMFPPSVSPTMLDPACLPFIDTSKPPPPIGVPLPGLPLPHVSPPPPPAMPLPPPNAAKHHSPRPLTSPQQPSQWAPKTPPNSQPIVDSRPHPGKWKGNAGGDSSAFAAMQDKIWDNLPLGGGYASGSDSLKAPSPVFLPSGGDLPPLGTGYGSPLHNQGDHIPSKGPPERTRDGTPGQKQWNKKEKARGQGIVKKDAHSVGGSAANKPTQGCGAANPARQPQEAGGSLSKEQAKNEYEWQSFKIVRKVRKVLGGLKDDCEVETAAAEIVGIMKAESSRLACFPWPKEQFVALDEILGWAIDHPEVLERVCKLIKEIHGLHPENFQEDLTNTMMKRHAQYIKVSTATNKNKLYASYSSLLANLFALSRTADSSFRDSVDKLLDLVVTKWITCDFQGPAEDPELLTKVYTFCLRALFVVIGPQLDSKADQKYNQLLRDQVLESKPRFVKEAMLDLLLLRAVGWKGSVDVKTESLESKREPQDANSKPAREEKENATDVPKESLPPTGGLQQTTPGDAGPSQSETSKEAVLTDPSAPPNNNLTTVSETCAAEESNPQFAPSDIPNSDTGNSGAHSQANDLPTPVPTNNDLSLGQDGANLREGDARDSQVEVKFKLPDKEVAERGAIVFDQLPGQTPNMPFSHDNSGVGNVPTIPQDFGSDVTSSFSNMEPMSSADPSKETEVVINERSATKTSVNRPSPSHATLLQHTNTPWGIQSTVGPPFSTGPSPIRFRQSTTQPQSDSPVDKYVVPWMPLSSRVPKTSTPSDTKPSAEGGMGSTTWPPSTVGSTAEWRQSPIGNTVSESHKEYQKPTKSPSTTTLKEGGFVPSQQNIGGSSSDALQGAHQQNPTATASSTKGPPKHTSPSQSASVNSSPAEAPLSSPPTTTKQTTTTSDHDDILGPSAKGFVEQSQVPHTEQPAEGSTLDQRSMNKNNNSGTVAWCSSGSDSKNNDQENRLQSSQVRVTTAETNPVPYNEEGVGYDSTPRNQQAESGEANDILYAGSSRHNFDSFWEEAGDKVSGWEQNPGPVSSAADYVPPQVYHQYQETSSPQEEKGGLDSQQFIYSGTDASGILRQEASHGQVEKERLSQLVAGGQRGSPSAFGRGMMKSEQSGGSSGVGGSGGIGGSSGRGSPALGFMTSPLAFIQAISTPQGNVARQHEQHFKKEAVDEQPRSDAAAMRGLGSHGQQLRQEQQLSSISFQICREGSVKQKNFDMSHEVSNSGDAQELETKINSDVTSGLLAGGKASLKMTEMYPTSQNCSEEGLQPTPDDSTCYFEGQYSQDGLLVQSRSDNKGMRASKLMSGKGDGLQDFPGGTDAEVSSETSDSSLDGEDPTNLDKEASQERSFMKSSPVTSEASVRRRQCKAEELLESRSELAEKPSEPLTKCPLCGSTKHKTRQCPTFKKYAPRATTCDGETEQQAERTLKAQKPKTEFRFGKTRFCSKCGQEGHLVYDCPVKGHFNIFKQFNKDADF